MNMNMNMNMKIIASTRLMLTLNMAGIGTRRTFLKQQE